MKGTERGAVTTKSRGGIDATTSQGMLAASRGYKREGTDSQGLQK